MEYKYWMNDNQVQFKKHTNYDRRRKMVPLITLLSWYGVTFIIVMVLIAV